VIGAFLIDAARRYDTANATGIAGALGAMKRQEYGHWLLSVVAAGLICHGLFQILKEPYRNRTAKLESLVATRPQSLGRKLYRTRLTGPRIIRAGRGESDAQVFTLSNSESPGVLREWKPNNTDRRVSVACSAAWHAVD
jgi:hypothetical protein